MKLAKPDAMVQLHCLPAHRRRRNNLRMYLSSRRRDFSMKPENRLHAQKAVLVTLMKYRKEIQQSAVSLFIPLQSTVVKKIFPVLYLKYIFYGK